MADPELIAAILDSSISSRSVDFIRYYCKSNDVLICELPHIDRLQIHRSLGIIIAGGKVGVIPTLDWTRRRSDATAR